MIVQNITRTITHVTTDKRIASLTFDDGPDPVFTTKVLEVLKKYDALATFFMSGASAHSHPDIVKKVASNGHAIGNHSWSHYAFTSLTLSERWKEIRKCEEAIKPYGLRLFRPPYGMASNGSNMAVFLLGYKIVGWSIDSKDWYEHDSKIMEHSLIKSIKPGSIILFHDRLYDGGIPEKGPVVTHKAITDREPMLTALEGFLSRLGGNLQFVTIPTLLRNGRPLSEKL